MITKTESIKKIYTFRFKDHDLAQVAVRWDGKADVLIGMGTKIKRGADKETAFVEARAYKHSFMCKIEGLA